VQERIPKELAFRRVYQGMRAKNTLKGRQVWSSFDEKSAAGDGKPMAPKFLHGGPQAARCQIVAFCPQALDEPGSRR
jgi:hypothetical protein